MNMAQVVSDQEYSVGGCGLETFCHNVLDWSNASEVEAQHLHNTNILFILWLY